MNGDREFLAHPGRGVQPVDHFDRRKEFNTRELGHAGNLQAIDKADAHIELSRGAQIDGRFRAAVVDGDLSLRRKYDLDGLQNAG